MKNAGFVLFCLVSACGFQPLYVEKSITTPGIFRGL